MAPRAVEKMVESETQRKKDPENDTVVIKAVRIKRPRIIRTPKVPPTEDEPSTPTETPSLPSVTPEANAGSATLSQPEINTGNTQLPTPALWKGVASPLQSRLGFLDRVCHPAIQYKLFLLFLSIWGASFILFYLSTSFALLLPDPFNLVVLGCFLVSTGLTGIYTLLLGIQHLRSSRQGSENRYY